jgi:hypothetical protein
MIGDGCRIPPGAARQYSWKSVIQREIWPVMLREGELSGRAEGLEIRVRRRVEHFDHSQTKDKPQ